MDWIDQMSNFHWLKSGISIDKYPVIGNGILNYYLLKRTVQSLGGYNRVSESNLWPSVVAELGLATRADLESSSKVQILYEHFVLPYEDYVQYCQDSFLFSSKADGETTVKNEPETPVIKSGPIFMTPKSDISPKERSQSSFSDEFSGLPRPNKRPNESLPSPPPDRVLRARRHEVLQFVSKDSEIEESELSASQNHGVWGWAPARGGDEDHEHKEVKDERKSDSIDESDEENEVPLCEICDQDAPRDPKCKRCENVYHYSCLGPRLCLISPSVPQKWYCPKCLVGDGMFLFDEGEEYDLARFQEVADEFREEYLETEFPIVNTDERELVECLVEQQFWNHVNDIRCKIAVEYGADIRCDIKGSGFPTKARDPYNRYSKHPWNLNNFPLNKMSLFHNMRATISGVNVPWAYVGMMFSAFCWHSEDHDTYSVNYQHFGNTKTWYGIPQYGAAQFEAFSRNYVPELFEKQPDILFQRATMIPPETLIKEGIPCYAIDQRAGQFVITFPHAYHAGFNHGFNFNEAVNYAPPDWVSVGKAAVFSYKQEKRSPIFSHDYLLVQTALNDRRKETAEWLYDEIRDMINRERFETQQTLQAIPGIRQIQVKSDGLIEDAYQCSDCLCLSYLSRLKLINAKDAKKVEGVYCHDHVPKVLDDGLELIMETRFTVEELEELCADIQSLMDHNDPLEHGIVQVIEV
jgi:[histone H3]-trimethyl-L-lysine4 demethylase